MVYKFRLVSDEVDNFRREIDIDADATFLSLRNAICDSVGYDKNQMHSFFLCEDGWEKDIEITLEDMGSDSSDEVYLMDECVLCDYIEAEGQRLIFVFDYMTERSFFIELKRTEPGKRLSEPICSLSMGQAPAQMMDLDEFEAKIDLKAASVVDPDLDAEFYGSDEYSADEFDPEAFDEMSFDENV